MSIVSTIIANVGPVGLCVAAVTSLLAVATHSLVKSAMKDVYDWGKRKLTKPALTPVPAPGMSAVQSEVKQEPDAKSLAASAAEMAQDSPLAELLSLIKEMRQPGTVEAVGCVSPAEIASSLAKVPPAQRTSIGKSYVGIRVHWVGWLASVTPDKEDKSLVLLIFGGQNGAGPYVTCTVSLGDFPALSVAPEKTRTTIFGTIESAQTSGIGLTEVHLQFDGISAAVEAGAQGKRAE